MNEEIEATEEKTIGTPLDEQGLEFIDGGRVLILVGDPQTGKAVPMPVPAVFEQLFAVLGDLDRRLTDLEGEPEEKSRIISI